MSFVSLWFLPLARQKECILEYILPTKPKRADILMERDIMRNVFYGVTHSLTVTGRQQALPIIELKKVLERLFNYTDKNL